MKSWLWTFRSLMLLVCCTAGIGLLQASDAPDTETVGVITAPVAERTYLYYFESSEAKLDSSTPMAFFAFGTLPKETVTLVAYGLDDIIKPELILTDADGRPVAEALPTGNPYVAVYRFEASEKRLYHVNVSRKNTEPDATGLVRVMVFEGDPITVDRTLLDNVNPLLPGRSFMVGSKEATEDIPGLSMVVEALPIDRFNRERPEIFASRGSDEFMPTLPERIEAEERFQWYNIETPDIEFYTVTVRATPETLDSVEDLDFRQLNANSFFYYDYYLIIGAGSDPVTVVRGDDCQNQPNRIECVGRGDSSGRTAPAPQLDVVVPEVVFEEGEVVIIDDTLPPPPPITNEECVGEDVSPGNPNNPNPNNPLVGGAGNDDIGGSNCADEIYGFGGDDNIAGGPRNDLLIGGDGDDILRGDEGQDFIYGGTGDDKIDGGEGYDFIYSGTGNDNIGYLTDTGYDHIYYDDLAAGVVVDLSTPIGGGTRNCEDIAGAYTGSVVKAGGQVDCLRGRFDVVTTDYDDEVTNNATQANYIDTLAGDDIVNVIGGSTRVYLGDGNDTVNFSGAISNASIFDSDSDRVYSVTPENFDDGDEIYNFLAGVSGVITIGDLTGTDLLDFTAIVGSDSYINLLGDNAVGFSAATTDIQIGGLGVDVNFYDENFNVGYSPIENVNATAQTDVIITNGVNNVINSYLGDDVIYASCGIDTLNAGGGTDLLSYQFMDAGVTVNLNATATIKGICGGDTDTLTGFENLTGSYYNDVLGGDGQNNVINALSGDDTVNAGGGDDTVFGGVGNDTLNGEAGVDTILGEQGDDLINGGAGDDILDGGFGDDTINGGDDDDTITGGLGVDILNGDDGEDIIDGGADGDTISGGDDDDTLNGSGGADTLNGDAGDDILDGGTENDTLNGGTGNDTLTGGDGVDTVNGGDGNDTVIVTDLVDLIDGGAQGLGGADTMDASTYGAAIYINLGTGVYGAGGTVNGIENVIGTEFDDTIVGDASVNNIQTGNGNDFILASAGNDVINGGGQTISTAADPGDTVSYVSFNTIMTTTINGTTAVVNVGGFTQNLTNIENLYGTNTVGGIDQVLITGGLALGAPAANTDPGFRITTTATSAAYTFTAAATGRVIVDNKVTDTFTFGTLNGFNPYLLNVYQDLGNGLYLMITRGLDTYCPTTPPGLTITVDANTTSTHTQCTTNETFNGQVGASNEGVSYVARPDNVDMTVTIGGNVMTVDDGPAAVIGTDTLNNIETLLLNNGDHTILVTGLPTNATSVDLGALAGDHTLDLSGYGANATVNLNAGMASFGGQITFQDDITTFIGSGFNDFVIGNGLDNIITTNGGNDDVIGGAGEDIIDTGAGDDYVNSGTGNDTVTTGIGNDTILGDTGDDILDGGDGNDYVGGGDGNDTIITGTGADAGYGNDGDDLFTVLTDNANDTYDGGAGLNDVLTYDLASGAINATIDGTDTALEGTGTDTWAGFEVVNTGNANDTFTLSNPVGYITINSFGGDDTINVEMVDGVIMPVFNAGDGADTFNVVNTGAANVVPVLLGQAGADIYNITFDAYDNVFDGGADADSVVYQGGTPLTLVMQVGNETVTDAGVTATDTLVNMESITLGTGADNVTVNDANGYTYVGGGDNNDVFDINAANAVTVLDGGAGIDTADIMDLGAVNLVINGTAQVAGVQQLENFETFYTSNAVDTFAVTTDNIAHTVDANLGVDTATLTSSSGLGVTIDVSIFGTTVADKNGTLATDTFLEVENFNGTAQDDTLNIQPFVLFGTEIIDVVSNNYNGMGGTDTATYNVTMTDLTVNVLAGGNITVQNSADLAAWTDTFVNFEQVLSGAGNDTWNMAAGVTSNNTFNANAGVDTADYSTVVGDLDIVLNATNTTLSQGANTHTLYNFESILTGAGDDNWTVNNGSGTTAYTFNGNTGDDSVSYNDTTSNWSYTATLTAGGNTVYDNDAVAGDEDTLINIEGLTTDDANDDITIHNSTILTVNTLGGDDVIRVGDAVAGTDNVANTFDMGAGTSDDLWYFNSNNGVVANYTGTGAGTVQEGAKAIDTFAGVENFAATNGNDTLNITADATTNIFYGMGGTDTVNFADGVAVTVGINTFTTTATGGGATDTIYTVETIIGSNLGDTFNIVNAAGSPVTSVQGDAGADIFNITNTGSAAFQMAGGAGADTYNFLAFDAFDNTIAEDGSANVINYSAVAGVDLDVELNAANTTVDNNVNTDTFTGTFATIQTGNGNDEIFVRRALTGATVQTNAGNDIFHFENDGVTDQIGNGATLLDAGTGIDTADFSTIVGALTVGYTGCATPGTVAMTATPAINSQLANFESFVGGTAADTFNVAFSPCDVTFNGAGGANEINYATTAAGTPLTFVLDGTDTVTDGTNTHSLVSFAIVRGSDNADVFTVVDDSLYTNLYGNGGDDTFNVQSNTAATTYTGDAGQDAYVIDFVTVDNYTVTMTGATGTVSNGLIDDTIVGIEDVTTGGGDDTFVLLGDAIVNNFDAGAGNDTADYSGDVTGLTFVLDGGATETVGNDTLTNFEAIIAGGGDDIFTVTGGGEVQYVTLDGNGGDDTFNIEWGVTDNIINGGTGDNSYAVAGVTTVDLTVTYASAASSTIVGGGATDTLNNISNIGTGGGDDTFVITVDNVDNIFTAGAGNDIADYSANIIDALVFELDGGAFETVDNGGDIDTLYGFESISTTSGNDIINLGTSDYAIIDGNDGDDKINVTDGAFVADVTINGDVGNDMYTYTGASPLTVALTNATNTITSAGIDHTLTGVEIVDLSTGTGAQTVTINDTAAVTAVTTGSGADTVTVTDGGTVATLNTGAGADAVTVADAGGMTAIDTGAGTDTVTMTQDLTNTTVNGGADADTLVSNTTGAATTITQAGANITVAAGGNSDVFQNFENGTFNTGAANDIFTIDTDVAGTWVLNSGTGTNRYNFIGSGLGAVSVTIATGNTTASALDTLDFSGMGAGINLNAGITTAQTVVGSFQLILQTAIANVEGSAFNDTITGTSSNDTINGNAGVDVIYGLAGDDDIDGGAGNDTIYGGTDDDEITGGAGNDTLYGGSLVTAAGACTVTDTGIDEVDGGADNDEVYGGNNNSVNGAVCADTGADTVTGGAGTDTVYGGNNNAGGATGNDAGDTLVDGGADADTVYGGNNNDHCTAGAGGDAAGTDGGDTMVTGGAGNDTVYGGNNNSCTGATGTDGGDIVSDTDGIDNVYGGNNNTGNNGGAAATRADGADTVNTNDGDNDVNYGDNNNSGGGSGSAGGTADTRQTNAGDTGGADND